MLLYWHPIPADDTLSVQLYPLAGGTVLADEALSDTDAPAGLYAADIGSPAEGTYAVRVLTGAAVIYQGLITITGAGPHVVDVTAQESSVQQAITAIGEIDCGAGGDGPGPGGSVSVAAFEASALAQIAGQRQIVIGVPALAGSLLSAPIVRGDSYLAAQDRALTFSRQGFPMIPDGASVVLSARASDGSGNAGWSLPGSVLSAADPGLVSIEATSAQTRAFAAGRYEFDVEVTFPGGEVVTFIGPRVYLDVIDDVSQES